jgi:protein gp37
MGENTAISWCHSTWNPWIGCTRVSPGCQHCYAEAFARRYNKAEWGPTAQRVRTSAANWRKPIIWNRKAQDEGIRRRVFCASLADVFEDNDQLLEWRGELFRLIEQTSSLDWLLLTKRPEHVNDMVPAYWRTGRHWPANLWIGTTVENQAAADKRIPALINIPAPVRFLSCEPLLGAVDLATWFWSMIPIHRLAGQWRPVRQ